MKTIKYISLILVLGLGAHTDYYDRDDHTETVAEEDNHSIIISEPILY